MVDGGDEEDEDDEEDDEAEEKRGRSTPRAGLVVVRLMGRT